MKFQIKGLKELGKNFDILKKEVQSRVRSSVKKGAGVIKKEAEKRASKDKKNLSKGIDTEVKVKKGQIIANVGVIKEVNGVDLYYSYYVHEGTKKITISNPFLREAVEENQEDIVKDIEKRLNRLFKGKFK